MFDKEEVQPVEQLLKDGLLRVENISRDEERPWLLYYCTKCGHFLGCENDKWTFDTSRYNRHVRSTPHIVDTVFF